MIKNALMDVDFLKTLTEHKERTVYARVVALDINEEPMDEITGRVTQGSITVDGTSSVRRSFSMSLVANEININDYYWGLHAKIQLYIGLENKVDKNYPDVIWFKQGTFIISGFTTAQSVNSYTINMQGKDKMSMLNGELGGTIKSLTADFDYVQVESIDNAGETVITKEKVPVKDIIREVVHQFGGEPLSNIIVNDLDEMGLELLEFRGDTLYFLIDTVTGEASNMITDGNTQFQISNSEFITLNSPYMVYDSCMSMNTTPVSNPTIIYDNEDGSHWTVAKFEYGDVCGYRLTDLTYPGTLTGRVGEPITTAVLDKIKNMLGNFEYFYDVDGHFIFQRKKTYLQKPFSTIINESVSTVYVPVTLTPQTYTKGLFYRRNNGVYVLATGDFDATVTYYELMDDAYAISAADSSPISYYFGDSNLVTSFNNSPNLNSLKNDFSIWGSRQSAFSDKKIPIHLRYAIDQKPTEYITADGLHKYTVKDKEEVIEEITNKYQLTKTPNPNGLPEEWWDVHEWAEFYRIRAGAYPTDQIGVYTQGYAENLYLWDYFNKPANWTRADTVNTDDVLYYVATNEVKEYHGTHCTHLYSWYMDQAQNGVGAYVYNPEIPEAVLEDVGKDTVFENDLTIHTNLDWREIIYQMALDFNANGHQDDFAIKVYQNNPELCRPNGTTGYETYYQDLLGFWRTLYDPAVAAIEDHVPDHDKKYYQWDDTSQKYIECKFEDITELREVDDDTPDTLYWFKGNAYSPITKFNSRKTYYQKAENIVLTHIDADTQYYRSQGGGEIEPCDNNKYFSIGYTYYEDKGYKRVRQLEMGKQYYTRTGSDGEYTYTLAHDFTDYNKIYFSYNSSLGDSGVDYVYVQQFSQGTDYYLLNEDTGEIEYAFTYKESDVFYEKVGYVVIADLETDHDTSDLYFLELETDSGNIVVELMPESLNTGFSIAHYHYIADKNVTNGKYYLYRGSDMWPKPVDIFKTFEYYKEYYEKINDTVMIRYQTYDFIVDTDNLYITNDFNPSTGWNTQIIQDPSQLNFWFDFLDSEGEIAKYSVRTVGDRSKAVNDDNVKSIYYRDTPNVIFTETREKDLENRKLGYSYFQVSPQMMNLFHITSKGKSAHDQLEEFLYNFTYCTESISMTTIPVYHLQPNTRILVSDQKSHIEGEYLVTRLTIPLTYNGTMNISATKAVDSIY